MIYHIYNTDRDQCRSRLDRLQLVRLGVATGITLEFAFGNNWLQTPDGFRMEGGRAVLSDFLRAALNHSTLVRFGHTVIAG